MQKVISILFAILFFATPLILWPNTSEVFEFNKMVFAYAMTTVIVCLWAIKCIKESRIIFRRTLLDIPLLIFLGSQFISTVFSIDPRTSVLGYYSRFNGGLLSSTCYSLLYWAFVSNMDAKSALSTIRYTLYAAAAVSVYGILEHFGIDKNIWVQDVQNRVFSTLGQPNWLAAFLVALIPLTFTNIVKKPYPYILSALFFITLLFTKSRSGLLGFTAASFVYWAITLIKNFKENLKPFLIFNILFLVLFFVVGSPFRVSGIQTPVSSSAPALETGGTESGSIRKIVWKGAIEIWKNYPVFGTGPETFAYTYPRFRLIEHNLVSEWDFIYNKAHNEYLNLLANTGTVGLLAYLALIIFSIAQLSKNYSLLAGYVSILVTNFFGFSVVPTQLLLFLFPAFAITLEQENKRVEEYKFKNSQKIAFALSCSLALILLYSISRYWYTDTLYAKGTETSLIKAVKISPNEPSFRLKLSESYTKLGKPDLAIAQIEKAISLSPSNVNLRRAEFSMFIRLSLIDPKYLTRAIETLEEAIQMAPTDAKLFYNLGLTLVRVGQNEKAIKILQKTIEMKPNYQEARQALEILQNDIISR